MQNKQTVENTFGAISFLVGWSNSTLVRMLEEATEMPFGQNTTDDLVTISKLRDLWTNKIHKRLLDQSPTVLAEEDVNDFVKLGTIEEIEKMEDGPMDFDGLKDLQVLAQRQFPLYLKCMNVLYSPLGLSQWDWVGAWINTTVEVADEQPGLSSVATGLLGGTRYLTENQENYDQVVSRLLGRKDYETLFRDLFAVFFDLENLKNALAGAGIADEPQGDKIPGFSENVTIGDGPTSLELENELRGMINESRPRAEAWLEKELERIYGKVSQ
ncbi:MAG: hypothetical protein HY225_03695 [Candidatus Vogelbacteria bacterium]|nr:hypothetical protein [Candidatus Vogelbacteria bacterium]